MKYLESYYYQITGNPQGHKLVFLHGLMGAAANWRRIIRDFEVDYHIFAFDQRGHGRSPHPTTGYHPSDYAEDLRHILDELSWEKVHLVGHSMGGRNAMEFAAQYPQRVNRLVIEDIGPDANPQAIVKIEKLLSLVPTPFANRLEAKNFFENVYPGLIKDQPHATTLARYFYSNIMEFASGKQDWRFDKNGILQSIRQGRTEERWDLFKGLSMPILVVRGEDSTDLTQAVYERMLKENPRAQGHVIKKAGHWVHFDQPEEFIQILKEFFNPFHALRL